MSKSYKKPILRDRARLRSERPFYSRLYRNKVKHFISTAMLGMYYQELKIVLEDFDDFSVTNLPKYDEAYNYWDFCDYIIDKRKECCWAYNNSKRCYKFPHVPLEIYKNDIQDICKKCRLKFSRK